MSLIDTLKHDHHEIFRLIEESQALGITTEEGRRKLKQAKAVIVGHLKLEDVKLYPEMQKHAETRALADTYSSEMRDISAEILQFFNFLEGGVEGMQFAREVGRVVARLKQRMTREEVRLYPAFQTHCE